MLRGFAKGDICLEYSMVSRPYGQDPKIDQENMKLVDVVIELLDARIPLSSRNPEIDTLVGQKPRIIALNKSDLSDPGKNRLWAQYFIKSNTEVIYTNAITGAGMEQLKDKLKELTRRKTESAAARPDRQGCETMVVVYLMWEVCLYQ